MIPAIAATGMKTEISVSDVATIGPETSLIASTVASWADIPSAIFDTTASTTTIASSTTVPIASTRPSSDSVLIEKPNRGKIAKVPINETGTVSVGINVERKLCRKMYTTRITSPTA